MLSAFILIPFLLLVILNIPLKYNQHKAPFWVTGGLLISQCVLTAGQPLLNWAAKSDRFSELFSFHLAFDSLTLIVLFTIGLVALVSLLVASGTITETRKRFNFINLLLITVIGMNTTALVRDIFSLYVFIEITAVATFVLIALEQNKFAIEGTFKYLVLSIIASVFMLTAIAFFLLACGDLSFEALRASFLGGENKLLLNFAAGLFLCGLLIKSGVVPFHGWVPDAYSDTQPSVSVLLAGIITKVSGVYALLRIFSSVFILSAAFQNVLLFTGTLSIVFAALAALTQNDMKRMLAYSSISQVGYIVLGLGCGTPLAFVGAVFHFFNHAVFKSLLFTNAASLEKKLGSTDIAIITGLGYQVPVTRATSVIGMLSTAGIPPLSGFWSKLIIIIALFSSGRYAYAAIALLASVLTLGYFLSLQRRIFIVKSEEAPQEAGRIPIGIIFSEILLAVITLGAGIGFPFILNTWMLPLQKLVH
jgi:proton-translocating NADH-quinone oxidoreductase chain N